MYNSTFLKLKVSNNIKPIILFVIFTLLFVYSANAQCAMCRAVLESEAGQVTGKGVNDGIVYLMAIPYILVGGLAFFIYRKFSNTENQKDK